MQFRGPLPGAVIAQVILINAVNNVRDPPRAAKLLQHREQFILAMEAAIRPVFCVIRDFRILGRHILMANSELLRKSLSVTLVRFRNRCRIGGNGDCIVAQRLFRGPCQDRRNRRLPNTPQSRDPCRAIPRSADLALSCIPPLLQRHVAVFAFFILRFGFRNQAGRRYAVHFFHPNQTNALG